MTLQEAVAQGRAVLFVKLHELARSVDARPILEYNATYNVIKVGPTKRYGLHLPLTTARETLFGQEDRGVCYLTGSADKVASIERLDFKAVIKPELWTTVKDGGRQGRVYITTGGNGCLRAAPIIEGLANNQIVVGLLRNYPTIVSDKDLKQLTDIKGMWFLGAVVFGIVVAIETLPRGKLTIDSTR